MVRCEASIETVNKLVKFILERTGGPDEGEGVVEVVIRVIDEAHGILDYIFQDPTQTIIPDGRVFQLGIFLGRTNEVDAYRAGRIFGANLDYHHTVPQHAIDAHEAHDPADCKTVGGVVGGHSGFDPRKHCAECKTS